MAIEKKARRLWPTNLKPAQLITCGDGGGVVGWINDAISGFFGTLVTAALNPLLNLLGRTLLTTSEPRDLPAIGELWLTSWVISTTAYNLLTMFGGIMTMSLGAVQARISIKEIAPRIPVGFLAANRGGPLLIFNVWSYVDRSSFQASPVSARNPMSSPGRYCIRFRPCLTA